jgi:serine/threonine-protein kinase
MSFQIGERVGDYQVVDVLGAGGMGKVYKVKNLFSERIEAMKILLPNLSSDPELADRFMREIKVQASLEHPNIAGLRTAQQFNGQLLMIVEFVDGNSLEQLMRQGPVPLPAAVDCVAQVLSALEYAHRHGVIHRDIKPANIMVTRSGTVKLMDFGIAKALSDRRLTQTGRTVGSLYYMSPEQIQGAENLDGRADLYSLGITLYELATGRRPFEGESDYSVMAAHLSQVPVPPVQLDSKIPAELNEIILQSIAKDPAQRFQSAEAFRCALDSVRRPGVAPAPPPPPPQPAVARGSSTRAVYMVAGSLATVAVLVLGALQLPRYFRTRAVETKPVSQAVQTAPQAIPAPVEQPPVVAPAVPKALSKPDSDRRPRSNAAQEANPPPQPPKEAVTPPPTPTAQASNPQPPVAQTPVVSAAQAAELEQLADRFNLMATRANTVRSGLKRLEQAQARMGLGLRGDLVTAASRVELFMDQSQAALKSADATAAKKAMDSAERELERVEKVLEGR